VEGRKGEKKGRGGELAGRGGEKRGKIETPNDLLKIPLLYALEFEICLGPFHRPRRCRQTSQKSVAGRMIKVYLGDNGR